MPYLLNVIYSLLILAVSPWLIYKAVRTGKYRVGMARKCFGLTPTRCGNRPCVWFHAVSVGEVLLLKEVIARFRRRHPNWECVLSTTTNTGFDLAVKNYPDVCVFYWPLDFTWAVKQALRRIRPNLVVLAELELWPNFIAAAKKQGCALAVINGRMSPRSYRGYQNIRPVMRRLLQKIDLFAVQNQDYANRLMKLGAPAERVSVTGSVKYDGVATDRNNSKTLALARLFDIHRRDAERAEKTIANDLIWVVGSSQAPEERMAIEIYRKAVSRFPNLRLFLVPRHKERFEEVAQLLGQSGLSFVRRSQLTHSIQDRRAIILLDTLGELGSLWGLADVAFVGGSLTQRGGQNMIEPAAYGAAVTFGPHVWNFQETVDRLLENHAAIQVMDEKEWEKQTLKLLGDPKARQSLGESARRFVLSQQGATDHTLDLLKSLMNTTGRFADAA